LVVSSGSAAVWVKLQSVEDAVCILHFDPGMTIVITAMEKTKQKKTKPVVEAAEVPKVGHARLQRRLSVTPVLFINGNRGRRTATTMKMKTMIKL